MVCLCCCCLYSLFIPPSHLLFCLYLPMVSSLTSSLFLSLPRSLSLWDSRWGLWPSSAFCSGSPERPMVFWTAHSSAPHISCKMQAPFFSLKKEAVECTHSEYIYRNELQCIVLKHIVTQDLSPPGSFCMFFGCRKSTFMSHETLCDMRCMLVLNFLQCF